MAVSDGWLSGKVALVVGGASGIGRGVVDTFVQEGARVGVLDRSREMVEKLCAAQPSVCASVGDVRNILDNERAVAQCVEKFGALDVLVVCAGITDHFTRLADLERSTVDAAFDEVFDINVKGSLLATRAALPELVKSEGNVVYTISNAGFLPGGGGPLYTASKFAVRGLMLQLSSELAPAIRVNAVAPGGTVTALRGPQSLGQAEQRLDEVPDIENLIRAVNPLRVAPTPADHSWAYLYLACKERTKAVTGCVIRSDGGLDSRGLIPMAESVGSNDMASTI